MSDSRNPKSGNPDVRDFRSNLVHFEQNVRNSSFTKTVGLAIWDIFFILFGVLDILFQNKKCVFLRVNLFLCKEISSRDQVGC